MKLNISYLPQEVFLIGKGSLYNKVVGIFTNITQSFRIIIILWIYEH